MGQSSLELPLEKADKISAIIATIQQVYPETARYSNFAWRIPLLFSSTLIGGVSVIKQVGFPIDVRNFWIITVALFAFCLLGQYQLRFCMKSLHANRKVLIRCREFLRLYEKDEFIQEPIMPESWKISPGDKTFYLIAHVVIFSAFIVSVFLLWGIKIPPPS